MSICHLVTFTFKERTSVDAIAKLSVALDDLAALSGALTYRHGRDLRARKGNADYAVTAVFEDQQACNRYLTSPRHLQVVEEFLAPHLQSRSAVQFSFEVSPSDVDRHGDGTGLSWV